MTGTCVDPLAVYDRPSAGTKCVRCGDWGTVVVRGRTTREVVCPVGGCEAAQRVRRQRGLDDHDS